MDETPKDRPSPFARGFFTIFLGAAGAFFVLEGLGVTSFGTMHRPPWTIAVFGVIFLAAAFLIAVNNAKHPARIGFLAAFVIIGGLCVLLAQVALDQSRLVGMTDGDGGAPVPEDIARIITSVFALGCGSLAVWTLMLAIKGR